MKKIIILTYLIIQLILYSLILFINTNIRVEFTTYSVIVLNMIMGVYLLIINKNKDNIYSLFALIFTLVSDTFLIFDINKIIAMISFCIVQILYMLKIKMILSKNKFNYYDIIRISVITIAIIILSIIYKDILISITTFYFIMLIFNLFESVPLIKKNWLIPIGLLLFILCDIFVSLDFLNVNLNISFNIIWFFYTPSQVFLTLSMIKKSSFIIRKISTN